MLGLRGKKQNAEKANLFLCLVCRVTAHCSFGCSLDSVLMLKKYLCQKIKANKNSVLSISRAVYILWTLGTQNRQTV